MQDKYENLMSDTASTTTGVVTTAAPSEAGSGLEFLSLVQPFSLCFSALAECAGLSCCALSLCTSGICSSRFDFEWGAEG